MSSGQLAGRFLHVNLNCDALYTTEHVYGEVLGLKARMRTDPKVATDGSILGLDDETYCETSFLYDARGGRSGCALEAIEYRSPALRRETSSDPVRPGIRGLQLAVADVDRAAAALVEAGLDVGNPVVGLISGEKSVLAVDPDGVVIELSALSTDVDPSQGALFGGIRMATNDAAAAGAFLTAIGFEEVASPATHTVAGAQLSPGGSGAAECMVARYALPEDGHQFTIVVVQHPDTPADPVPWGGNHQGLYRCALRVENVHDALAQVPETVQRVGDPVWCPLPGTKIEGLHIAFLRSPEGVVFEFVERPLSFF